MIKNLKILRKELSQQYWELEHTILHEVNRSNALSKELTELDEVIEHLEHVEKLGMLDGRTEEGTSAAGKRNSKAKSGKRKVTKKK
jgi:hypothetical protein